MLHGNAEFAPDFSLIFGASLADSAPTVADRE
jgi:hypothetical protein